MRMSDHHHEEGLPLETVSFYVRAFIDRVGQTAMADGVRLVRPKAYGRMLRMIAKQSAVLQLVQEGIVAGWWLRLLQTQLALEMSECEKHLESRWVPRRCGRLAPVALDFDRCLRQWHALDVADLQRLHRSAIRVLGPAAIQQIKGLIEIHRPTFMCPPSLSNPLRRDDG
jgi:hypothetical protein